MCTAITYLSNSFYFGRNLDLEHSYGEKVVITPRNYPFRFRNGTTINHHYAMIGMAAVSEEYPLYFERDLVLPDSNFLTMQSIIRKTTAYVILHHLS